MNTDEHGSEKLIGWRAPLDAQAVKQSLLDFRLSYLCAFVAKFSSQATAPSTQACSARQRCLIQVCLEVRGPVDRIDQAFFAPATDTHELDRLVQ
jgi:hypothetical protein